MILFVSKNYPENILEICLEDYKSPEEISRIMKDIEVFDYFNVYDIFSNEGTASVYSGNVNLFLYGKSREDIGITYENNEVIMGSKFVENNLDYFPLGEKYNSIYGEYYVTCIIEGNDRIYYRNLDILKTARIKNQRIYISTVNAKKFMMYQQAKIQELKYYGVNVANGIAYVEVTNTIKKLGTALMIAMSFLIFGYILGFNKRLLSQLMKTYKDKKYDLELWEFIKHSYKLILKQAFIIILQILSVFFILYSVFSFLNVHVSYDVDLSSLKSIIDTIMSFVNMLAYYSSNGFTDVAYLIVNIILIYIFSSFIFWIICIKIENIKLRKHLKD